jgi:vancomycin resistance protein VanJ
MAWRERFLAHPVTGPARRRGWARWGRVLACAYPGALLALCALQALAPRRTGPLALAEVILPYLFLPLVLIVPALFLPGAVVLRLCVAACLLAGVRFLPVLPAHDQQGAGGAKTITVLSWNVAFGQSNRRAVQQFIESQPADVVALEEDYNVWWDPDYPTWQRQEAVLASHYPHQVRYSTQGLSILSVYPVVNSSEDTTHPDGPGVTPFVWARLDLGGGQTVIVAAAHPRDPTRSACPLTWLCYDPTERDTQIEAIRASLAPLLQHGEPVLLVGDFNLTDREPAYQTLARGLHDDYRLAGAGLGHTWRPLRLARYDIALLRIDYMFSTARVTPLGLDTDCTSRGSDHCALLGRFAVH